MTRGDLAAWLRKTPGEVYLPVLVPEDVVRIVAKKRDVLAYLDEHPNEPSPWRVTDHIKTGRNWYHQIFLDADT